MTDRQLTKYQNKTNRLAERFARLLKEDPELAEALKSKAKPVFMAKRDMYLHGKLSAGRRGYVIRAAIQAAAAQV